MVKGYISLAEARASQAALLESALPEIAGEVRRAQATGTLSGPGPIFLGIGASYAASAAAVWVLRSRGILSACAQLDPAPGWLPWLRLVPRPLADLGYRLFARVRYRLFGRRDACRVPAPEERARFLE